MPIHDWTRVTAGTFHDFHQAWITHLKESLNGGVLPAGYYAMSEQIVAAVIPDVLTLRAGGSSVPSGGGGLLTARPKTRHHLTMSEGAAARLKQRVVTIRQAPDHRLVAVIEIASPANKDRPSSVTAFVAKAVDLVHRGVHLLLVELFAPGRHDPEGLHGAIWDALGGDPSASDIEPDKPLRLASYLAGELPEAFVEPAAVSDALPDMPLYLDADRHVDVPMAATYDAAWRGVPEVWKRAVEGR